MADSLHLIVAIVVFLMLLIGLILTVLEFRRVMDETGDRQTGRGTPGSARGSRRR